MKQSIILSRSIPRRVQTIFSVLLAGVMLSACQNDINSNQTADDAPITSADYSPRTVLKQHKISAFVQPVEYAQLAFQVSGRISQQHVDIGQQVNKGEALLEVYNPGLAPQIEHIQGQLEANQADLTQTRAELKRNQSLSDIQAISQNQLDRLDSRVKQLKSQQEALNAQLKAAKNNFKETTLSAPFAGDVADILVKPGTMVKAGQAVIELSGTNIFEAPLFISNELLKHLQHNQNLTAHHDSATFTVSVKEISRSANPASQLFKVLVSLPPETGILAGEKIEVSIPEPIKNVYQLPVSAVIDDGINEPYIYVLESDQVKHKAVQIIGFYDNQIRVRIDQPQNTAITVISEGQSTLTPPGKNPQP